MEKPVKLTLTLLLFFVITSFTNPNNIVGTYGVSPADPSQIRLTLNSDYTFYYQDFSAPNNKISINGIWHLSGKKIVLKNKTSGSKFHYVWIITENGKIAKSRKGLCFYRLCKIENK